MQTSDDGTLTVLRSLLQVCQDSAEGYATAERDFPDLEFVNELEQRRKQRLKILTELQRRIRDLRGDPDVNPSTAGAVHRKWMDFKSETAANPTEALLTEMERGEDLAVDAFREALKREDLDAATRKMLQHHYELVQAAHDRVKQLRDRANYARQ